MLRKSATLTAVNGAAQLILALTLIVAARIQSPSLFGQSVAAYGVAQFAILAVDGGLSPYAIRAVAMSTRPARELAERVTIKLTISLSLLIGAALAYAFGRALVAAILVLVAFSSVNLGIQVGLRARETYLRLGIGLIAERLCHLVLYLLFHHKWPEAAVMNFLAAATAAAFIAWPIYARLLDEAVSFRSLRFATFGEVTKELKKSFPFALSSISVQWVRLDAALLQALQDAVSAGLFSAASRALAPLTLLPTSISGAVFARASRAPSHRLAFVEVKSSFLLVFALSGCIVAVVIIIAEPLVLALYGPAYAMSAPVMRLYALGSLFVAVNSPLSSFSQARGRERAVSVVILASSLIGLATFIFGARLAGALGAAAGFVLMQVLIMAGLLIVLKELLQHGKQP